MFPIFTCLIDGDTWRLDKGREEEKLISISKIFVYLNVNGIQFEENFIELTE